jgi:hypothetical protein
MKLGIVASAELVGIQQNSERRRSCQPQFTYIVTDLRHHLILNRIKHRTYFEVKGEDGIESLVRPPAIRKTWRHGSDIICRRNVLTLRSFMGWREFSFLQDFLMVRRQMSD